MLIDAKIKDVVFSVTGFNFDGEISVKDGIDGVYVKYDGKDAVVGFASKSMLARALFLLSLNIQTGKTSFEITETPKFDTMGPMLDVSRGMVMRVEAIKKYIDVVAALGMNMFMLYTEDLFELKDYPMFGYLRGAYTLEELKEVDDYAYSLGVEVIPCIQTLGHLAKFLRWAESKAIADNSSVLLVGEQKTYDFIEAEIKFVREAFRSDRIHLGMDEAFGLGQGKYKKLHGERPEADIFYEHLEKVLEISAKYFEKPMIWSDMLFNNPDGIPYYDKYVLPQDRVENAPKDVSLVYWDYYRDNTEYYDALLTQHVRFDNEIMFAGGLWTWDGLAPNFTYTYKTMKPAFESCLKFNIKTFIITLWASGRSAADFMHALPMLAMFSEYMYKGADVKEDDIWASVNLISGLDKKLADAISDQYIGLRGARSFGKAVLYGDPLIKTANLPVDYKEAYKIYADALAVIKEYTDYEYYDFYVNLFEIGVRKIDLYINLQKAYKAGDKSYIEKAANIIIPEIQMYMNNFYQLFVGGWKLSYKPFGIEQYTHDLGGPMLRLSDVKVILDDYLSGKTNVIEELEAQILEGMHRSWKAPTNYISTYDM